MARKAIFKKPNEEEILVNGRDLDDEILNDPDGEFLCSGKDCNGNECRCRMIAKNCPGKDDEWYFSSDDHIPGCEEARKKTTVDITEKSIDETDIDKLIRVKKHRKVGKKPEPGEDGEGGDGVDTDPEPDVQKGYKITSRALRNVQEVYNEVKKRPLDSEIFSLKMTVGDFVIDNRTINKYSEPDISGIKLIVLKTVKPPFIILGMPVLISAYQDSKSDPLYFVLNLWELDEEERAKVWKSIVEASRKKQAILAMGHVNKCWRSKATGHKAVEVAVNNRDCFATIDISEV